jgi:hypothetical protein
VAYSAPAGQAFVPDPLPVSAAPFPVAGPVLQAKKGGTEAVAIVTEVACPSCGMNTMVTPGTASVCFSCGQPIPANVSASNAPPAARSSPLAGAAYPLTSAVPQVTTPPFDPYAQAAPRLRGPAGDFALGSAEIAIGRDPAKCKVLLSEPRVSGVHAHVKLDGGLAYVRDEGSNNGTFVDGARIAPNVWVPVRAGAELRFGPVAFTVSA